MIDYKKREGFHAEMVSIAESLGLPESYKDDLYKHDLNAVMSLKYPARFVWILRTCGTHLIEPDADQILKGSIHLDAIRQAFQSNNKYWFYFENGKLVQSDFETCVKKIDQWESYKPNVESYSQVYR